MRYQELCKECLQNINKELHIKGEEKEVIKIDEDHIYMIGKNGPVIKNPFIGGAEKLVQNLEKLAKILKF